MKERTTLSHEFVRTIPDELEERTLYISMDYATVVHKCCCGCGQEVVTPLSPTDWKLTYNGESVTLFPSIGNWGFDCRSHYWIDNSTVRWAEQWTPEQIEAGRAADRRLKGGYYEAEHPVATRRQDADADRHQGGHVLRHLWTRLRGWWQR
ncbi:MAG: DUF6527 family protein [Gammaproteobacteria bacterium]|nr:DUF6527 family protein [Gammaproteobacteria bacterium]